MKNERKKREIVRKNYLGGHHLFNIYFYYYLPEHFPVHLSAESRPSASLQRPTPQSLQSFSAVRPSSFENVPLGQVGAQEDPVNPNSG